MLTKSVFLVAATIVTMTLRGTSSFVGQTHLGARSVAVATNRLLLRSNRGDTNGDFWDKQKQLVAEMNASSSEKSLREYVNCGVVVYVFSFGFMFISNKTQHKLLQTLTAHGSVSFSENKCKDSLGEEISC